MLTLPQNVESWILYNLKLDGLYEKGERVYTKRIREIRNVLKSVSDYFITKRSHLKEKVFQNELEDGYLAFFSPLSFVKTFTVITELIELCPEILRGEIRLLDIGAGQGAGTMGAIEALNKKLGKDPVEIVCLDRRSPQFNLLEGLNIPHRYVIADVDDVKVRKFKNFNLVLIVNALTEAYGFEEQNPFQRLMLITDQLTAEDGIIVIIEPAMKDSTRILMKIGERIRIERKDLFIVAPCIGIKECPMLKITKRKEWCHFGVHWEIPQYMKILNRELGRELHFAKFSYLVISKNSIPLPEWYINNMRVVSNLLHEKGKKRFYVCHREKYKEFERLDRDATDRNKAMEELNKGDVIKVEEETCIYKGGRMRILKDTGVTILRPFSPC